MSASIAGESILASLLPSVAFVNAMQERQTFRGIATIIASRSYSHANGGGVKFKLRLEDESQRELDHSICLLNPNPEVVRTGNQRLAMLCMACRKATMTDTEELHGLSIGVSYLSNGIVIGVIALAKPRELFPLEHPKPVKPSLWSQIKGWFNA